MTESQKSPDSRRRLPSVDSVVDAVAPHVTDLNLVPPRETPEWLQQSVVPDGWKVVHLDTGFVQPTRTAVAGARDDGGWDGCETISVYRFTGAPPCSVVSENNDCTLRGLGGESLTTHMLTAPAGQKVCAVRSTGYFTAAGRRMWAQYSTYVVDGRTPGGSWLALHGLFVSADSRARLRDDVTALSDAVHEAFLTAVVTVNAEAPTMPIPVTEAHPHGS
ncbi:hypothetical protein H7J71_23135 [Mycolicibacterium peregrinum]|uniref:hypothetical protein n=1 Tax=Mycolicibacterium peregrinum TaxID=43304 RepID=UPI0006D7CFCD|nr:hypothetical protein [Mycolicibacterium peregrinum]MCV7204912.1 hypothetical protein [Mycolicibacterium peregrinum]ORW59507.1 hypothetical protein AWC21_12400 [Mycolicibacterium peregrinum]